MKCKKWHWVLTSKTSPHSRSGHYTASFRLKTQATKAKKRHGGRVRKVCI